MMEHEDDLGEADATGWGNERSKTTRQRRGGGAPAAAQSNAA